MEYNIRFIHNTKIFSLYFNIEYYNNVIIYFNLEIYINLLLLNSSLGILILAMFI